MSQSDEKQDAAAAAEDDRAASKPDEGEGDDHGDGADAKGADVKDADGKDADGKASADGKDADGKASADSKDADAAKDPAAVDGEATSKDAAVQDADAEDGHVAADAKDAPSARSSARRRRRDVEIEPPVTTPATRAARVAYWMLWFAITPFVFACVLVWGLTPPSGVENTGVLGWIQSAVREQPVPVGIGAFALMEMALGAIRRRLPLARFAYPPLRPDIPDKLRPLFERAVALLEEADLILRLNEKPVQRELTSSERTKLHAELDALRHQMRALPFDEDAFVDALSRADGEVDVRLGRWRKSEAREYVESILVAVAVALLLRTFVVEAFKIPSGSMIPTLQVGDHIFVSKFSYGPEIPYTSARIWTKMPPDRGDVMVFQYPENMEQDFIKRVIALPGDKLEARGGHPIINGWEVPSCLVGPYAYDDPPTEPAGTHHEGDLYVEYLGDESYLTFYDRINGVFAEYQGPFFVKPGEVYVMGDNRNNSRDSRLWWGGQGGGVPFANMKGRALFVWLSYTPSGLDWSRFGVPVMGRPRAPRGFAKLQPALDKCLRERPPIAKTTPPPPAK